MYVELRSSCLSINQFNPCSDSGFINKFALIRIYAIIKVPTAFLKQYLSLNNYERFRDTWRDDEIRENPIFLS